MTDDPLPPQLDRPVRLGTADGGEVAGDLATAKQPWAGAVVCHPHPAYGGDRHNVVVDRIYRTLAAAGVTTARFDFRPTGSDGGSPDDRPAEAIAPPSGEQADVLAALDLVAGQLDAGRPLWLVGYSFGADIALSIGDDRVAGWVAVAPPLRFGPPARPAEGDGRPVLVLAAEHDQYNPPDRLRAAVSSWPDATVTVLPMADHFLAGAAGRVADEILAWLESGPAS